VCTTASCGSDDRKGVVRMPYVLFLRVNPNACDAEGSDIGMKTRIRVVAKKVREFLLTPQEEFYRRADDYETILPHVECLHYHTREGAKNLALYRFVVLSHKLVR
jgi:hypothetical protein